MSVLARRAVENNLAQIQKQLGETDGGDEELKALEARLTTEKDKFVKTLIAEKVERLKRAQKEPSPYQKYKKELEELQMHLSNALEVMNTIPFYVNSTRGKRPGKTTKTTRTPRTKKQ